MAESYDRPLARATLWRWVAQALWYPDDRFLDQLHDPADRAALRHAAAVADPGGGIAVAIEAVWRAAERSAAAGPRLAEEHTYLFARNVLVPPREDGYAVAPGLRRSAALAELAGLYAAFGLQTSSQRRDLPDHISIQLEFVAVLLAKEVYAAAQGWEEQASAARQARSLLLREHLAEWVPLFQQRLVAHYRLDYYPAVVALVTKLLDLELASLQTDAGPQVQPATAFQAAAQ